MLEEAAREAAEARLPSVLLVVVTLLMFASLEWLLKNSKSSLSRVTGEAGRLRPLEELGTTEEVCMKYLQA